MKAKKSKLNNLDQRLKFLDKIDHFKHIQRKTISIRNRTPKENDAEHTWHTAMWFLVFKDIFGDNVDLGKVLTLIMIHDLPEIYAGDVLTFTKTDRQREREVVAAKKIFGHLPAKMGREYLKLWEEYEGGKTKEAKIAKSFDKLQPILQGLLVHSEEWRKNGITQDIFTKHKRKHMEHDEGLMIIFDELAKKTKKYLKK